MLNEALAFLGLTGGSGHGGRPAAERDGTREEQRRLAATVRALPGRFADRLSGPSLERITGAAASGQWEDAVDDLLTTLCVRGEAITGEERADLRAVLMALNMPGRRVEALIRHRPGPSRPA